MIYIFPIVLLLGAPNIQALIDAQRWDDAEAQLASVSADARPRFEGLIAHGRGQPALAADAFERALLLTPDVAELHLHAAHAYFELKQFEAVLKHAQAASSLRDKAVAQPLLEARALEGLNRDADAYGVLNRACKTYTQAFRPCLEFATFVHRKKLVIDVRRAVSKLLTFELSREVAASLFHLLYDDRDGLPVLEQIVAKYPRDGEMRSLLAHVYARHRRWFTAARLFEEATGLGGNYAFEAADQYRMAGQYRKALRMNGLVTASQAQAIQRLSILFEQKQYARIVSMSRRFTEPAALYRVAYAHYAMGDYTKASRDARALLETTYRQEAIALLEAIRMDSTR